MPMHRPRIRYNVASATGGAPSRVPRSIPAKAAPTAPPAAAAATHHSNLRHGPPPPRDSEYAPPPHLSRPLPHTTRRTHLLTLTLTSLLTTWPALAESTPDTPPPTPAIPPPWWQDGADTWLELSSPADLESFLSPASAPSPSATPSANRPSPKLLAVEFYAKSCPVCASKSAELLEVASDARTRALCTFARADVDALQDSLASLGVKHVPTVVIYSPEGYKLIDFIASGDGLREAIASLSTVFRDQSRIPASYQADLANLPPTADLLRAEQYAYDAGDAGDAGDAADEYEFDGGDEDSDAGPGEGVSIAGGSSGVGRLPV